MGIGLDDVKLTFCEWLDLKQHELIDVVFGTIIANEFQTDPISLYVIGPPSVGKTEVLRALNAYPKVYPISTLTPNTLISGMKGQGRSLLLNLKDSEKNILVVKDFTTILETKADARAELISQIREIMDGSYRKSFGTGRTISWEGKLYLICGVTPVIDRYHSVHSVLGERFLNFRFEANEENKMSEKAISMAGHEKAMRQELQGITSDFLQQFKEPKFESIKVGEEVKQKIFALVSLIAKGRTGVSRDRYHQTIDYLPQTEGTPRLIKQIWTLGCGISVIQGKNEIDDDIYSILKQVGRDSLPSHRDRILETMFLNEFYSGNWETTKALSKLINCPTTTARMYLEDLMMVGILNRKIQGEDIDEDDSWKRRETTPYLWQLSDKCLGLIEKSETYKTGDEVEDYDENFDFKP